MAGSLNQRWCLSQFKGKSGETSDGELITCLKFDQTGEFLAVGNKGGQIAIFQQDHLNKDGRVKYDAYASFQSHEAEFDYLKSVDIEEKINDVQWVRHSKSSHFLLSTNEKTIKLWKISERSRELDGFNLEDKTGMRQSPASLEELRLPVMKSVDTVVEANPRRVFANAHTYHVNSISVNSDQETFLSADDLRINLWHMDRSAQSFNIVDIKPSNMEELAEVITVAEFHPSECSLLVYGNSRGGLLLCDMRSQALCDKRGKSFFAQDTEKNFFTDVLSSISDVKFSHNGRYMMSRDYLTAKIWDLRMETQPVEVHQVHSFLRTKLCSLYENECMFDKFLCTWSPDDRHILTGSYNNFFRIVDRETRKDALLEASVETLQSRQQLKPKKVTLAGTTRKKDEISVEAMDFGRKILHTTWHPHEDVFALASSSSWYLFEASKL